MENATGREKRLSTPFRGKEIKTETLQVVAKCFIGYFEDAGVSEWSDAAFCWIMQCRATGSNENCRARSCTVRQRPDFAQVGIFWGFARPTILRPKKIARSCKRLHDPGRPGKPIRRKSLASVYIGTLSSGHRHGAAVQFALREAEGEFCSRSGPVHRVSPPHWRRKAAQTDRGQPPDRLCTLIHYSGKFVKPQTGPGRAISANSRRSFNPEPAATAKPLPAGRHGLRVLAPPAVATGCGFSRQLPAVAVGSGLNK
jgi:hypothetical protein